MKSPVLILLSVVISTVVSIAAISILNPAGTKVTSNTEEVDQLKMKIEELSKTQKQMLVAQQDFLAKLDTRDSSTGRVSQNDIQLAVSNWMQANADKLNASAPEPLRGAPMAAKASATNVDFNATLEQLQNPQTNWNQRQALWKKLREAGLMSQAVAAYEKRAKESPQNADFQADLGSAYLQVLQTVPEGPEKGTWAMKADKCFDDGLAVDDHHWQSRFMKATSLSFWPPVFGKQNEAIQHFETLVSQQEAISPKPEFTQTYLFLGNMYQQQGKMDKAREAWTKGLKVFPDSEELKKQLAVAGNSK